MITRSDMLYVPWTEIDTAEAQRIKRDNTFFDKDGVPVYAYYETDEFLALPRTYDMPEHEVVDQTTAHRRRPRMKFNTAEKMYPFQMVAVYSVLAQMRKKGGGLLECRTGGGKTVMGLKISTVIGMKTLILVDTLDLMVQWKLRIERFVPGAKIALYNGGKKDKSGWEDADYVIATFQTVTKGVPEAFRNAFGFLIVDECHVAAAPTFLRCVALIRARFRLGLTATPYREDKLEGLFFAHLGPTLYVIKKEDVDALGVTVDPDVFVVDTEADPDLGDYFMWRWDPEQQCKVESINHAKLLTDICLSDEHNDTIKAQLLKATAKGRKLLGISDRNDQLKAMHKWCLENGINASIITGEIRDINKRVEAFQAQVVLSNFKIVEKGLDCPELDTLFFLSVRKAKASVTQAVGRVSRNYVGKRKPLVVIFRPRCGLIRNQVRTMVNILDDLGCTVKSK